MWNRAAEYSRLARECIKAAEVLTDLDRKAEALHMASGWLKLAEQAKGNAITIIVYTLPPESSEPSPAAC